MLYGLISDIHSNLEALETVLDHLAGEGVERYICLGDLVGYGADPNRCVEVVRDLTDLVIAGNHDWAAIDRVDTTFFNPNARAAADWTTRTLTPANRDYLRGLPLDLKVNDCLLVHATPSNPENWDYLLSLNTAEKEFDRFPARTAFIGHSHIPVVYYMGKTSGVSDHDSPLRLEDGVRYIINIGSVGQPRDGDPRASFALYDSTSAQVTIRRLDYPVEKAQDKIINAGLPPKLAQRLEAGR